MRKLLIALLLLVTITAEAQQILSVREQSRVVDELLGERINQLLPKLMQEEKIDMWVIISREYKCNSCPNKL